MAGHVVYIMWFPDVTGETCYLGNLLVMSTTCFSPPKISIVFNFIKVEEEEETVWVGSEVRGGPLGERRE